MEPILGYFDAIAMFYNSKKFPKGCSIVENRGLIFWKKIGFDSQKKGVKATIQ